MFSFVQLIWAQFSYKYVCASLLMLQLLLTRCCLFCCLSTTVIACFPYFTFRPFVFSLFILSSSLHLPVWTIALKLPVLLLRCWRQCIGNGVMVWNRSEKTNQLTTHVEWSQASRHVTMLRGKVSVHEFSSKMVLLQCLNIGSLSFSVHVCIVQVSLVAKCHRCICWLRTGLQAMLEGLQPNVERINSIVRKIHPEQLRVKEN